MFKKQTFASWERELEFSSDASTCANPNPILVPQCCVDVRMHYTSRFPSYANACINPKNHFPSYAYACRKSSSYAYACAKSFIIYFLSYAYACRKSSSYAYARRKSLIVSQTSTLFWVNPRTLSLSFRPGNLTIYLTLPPFYPP